MRDCLQALEDEKMLSKEEASSAKRMFKEFLSFCKDVDIIEVYDSMMVDTMIDQRTDGYEEEE
jgi:hypothetical protein